MSTTESTVPVSEQPASSSSTPTPSAITSPSPPEPRERDGPIDPRVVALRPMFPDYDDLILQSVLESVQWNQDQAVDALLGMSDPEYKPVAAPVRTQADLDAEFAQRLYLEEQHEQQRRHQLWQQQQQQQQQAGVPYQVRPGHVAFNPNTGPPAASQGAGASDFQQQFNKIAETGKKTFGSLFSKVKAKLQEFEQPQQSQQQYAQPPGPNPIWTPPQQNQFNGQQPAYFAPTPPAGPAPVVTAPKPQPAAQGYDAVPDPTIPAASGTSSVPRTQSPGVPASVTTPPPPATGSGFPGGSGSRGTSPPPTLPIAAGKFGLLPKQPVSLLRENPAPANPRRDDSDDELEYTENPFEESERKK